MTVAEGPLVWNVPVLTLLGTLGYIVAFFNSVWIIVGIWRSGKA
jgi:ubiquinone biosynthesis protein